MTTVNITTTTTTRETIEELLRDTADGLKECEAIIRNDSEEQEEQVTTLRFFWTDSNDQRRMDVVEIHHPAEMTLAEVDIDLADEIKRHLVISSEEYSSQ